MGKGGWRQPLTMGNQSSETQAEFNARAGLSEPIDFKGPQPFNLQAHHNEGPSKVSEKKFLVILLIEDGDTLEGHTKVEVGANQLRQKYQMQDIKVCMCILEKLSSKGTTGFILTHSVIHKFVCFFLL